MKNIYRSKTSKGLNAVLFTLILFGTSAVYGAVSITKFPALSLCTTYPSAYTTGSFSITETSITTNKGFTRGQTSTTLIIDFSNASFGFNPGVGTVTVTGTEVTIVSYSITAASITVTITTAATNTQFNTINFNGVQIRATATGTGFIRRNGGTFKVDNKAVNPLTTTSWGDLTALVPVAYSTSSATQAVTSSLFSGSTDNQIIGVQVVITGTCGTLTATSFNFNTTGSTAPGTDISNAKLYYSGTTNLFSTSTLFGSVSSPNGAFTISGSQVLNSLAGTYYFWLTYDITSTPVSGNLLDAQHVSTVISGTTYTNASGNPAGSRTISNNIFYSIAPGNWSDITTVWSRTSGGPACSCAPTGGTGFVYVNHAVPLDNASYTVNNVTVQSGGNLTNAATRVLTVTDVLTTTGTGVFSASTTWILKDVTTAGTGTSSSSAALTLTGNLNVGTGSTFQMTGGVLLTVNGNITTNGTLALGTSNVTNSNASGTIVQGTGSITGSGTITLGVNKTIPVGSNLTIAPVVNITNTFVITNNGTVNMQNNITGGGVNAQWTNAINSILDMGGTTSALLATGRLEASPVPNTVRYSGSGDQSIKTPVTSYYNLTVSSSAAGIKSLTGAITVAGDIQISTGAQLNAAAAGNTITLDGNWINNSTNAAPFNPSTSTVLFNGGTNTISGSGITSFNNVTINAISILTSNSSIGKVLVLGNWACEGSFNHNNADITFDGTSTLSGASFTTFNTAIVNAAKTLTLHATETDFDGDITSNGTLNHNSGLVVFTGIGSTQNVNGSASALTLFSVQVANPAGTILLARPLTINSPLTLTAGILSIGANTLTLTGAVTGSGTFTGSSTSNLTIGGVAGTLNFTSGSTNNFLKNFTINAGASATLGNALNITGGVAANTEGVVTVANTGSLTTGGFLTMKSNINGTARVAANTSGSTYITGNVTVERYITATGGVAGRRWHLLSGKSTATTQNIYQSWQENGVVAANLGTWITSTTFNGTNGYDATNINSSSILYHNQVTPAWVTPTATNSGSINDRQGYMLFVRGDRSDLPANTTNTPTVLRTNGTLRQGNQLGVTVSATGSGRTLVGNPYASPIDMETIFTGTANLDQNMMVWDPALTGSLGLGGYRSVVRTGVNTYDHTPVVLGGTTSDPTVRFIHSGQAVFLKATTTDASVVFTETVKAASTTTVYNPIVATTGDQQIIANLMIVQPGNIASLADGIRVRFNAAYSDSLSDDIEKMGNFRENISSYREGKKLIVEQRPMIVLKDTIFLRITNTSIKNYRLQIGTFDFVQTTATAYLQDTYLNTVTSLDLTGNVTEVDFSVTADPASANQDRFRIIFALSGPLPSTITSVKAAQKDANIAVEWKASNQYNMQKYEVEKSTDGVNFTMVNTQAAVGTNGSDATYNWLDVNPVMGNNYYRIRSIGISGDIKISQAVVVKISKGNPAITVYPNPVINRTIGLQFTGMEKGMYRLRLVNMQGQVVFTQTLNNPGGNATQTIQLGYAVAKGNYRLEFIKPDDTKTVKSLIIAE